MTSSFNKCLLASTGVGFAVVLMFMQIGFRNALIDNNIQLFTLFDPHFANLAMVSQSRYNISTEQRFPRSLLEQAASIPGVSAVCSVSVERATARVMVEGHVPRPLRVIAVELQHASFFSDQHLFARLVSADAQRGALVDTLSKPAYGFANNLAELQQQSVELNNRSLPIVGQFTLGTDFANDGSLLMSAQLLNDYFPWRSPGGMPADVVDLGLLQVAAGSKGELERIAAQIERIAPQAIDVRPTSYFIAREQYFWANQTPIGKIFLIGTIMGLVVGAIICFQIQFTDINEHMPEFATLKAMGYGTTYFWSLILSQSFYLACLGFVPGLIVAQGMYWLLAQGSGLVMSMTWDRILLVWGLTLAMCCISGVLAIRKLFRSDPASLF
ncbi:MAG: FtsX-like permease family protein [Aureliella sp.]